jgi:hypothetical protein
MYNYIHIIYVIYMFISGQTTPSLRHTFCHGLGMVWAWALEAQVVLDIVLRCQDRLAVGA